MIFKSLIAVALIGLVAEINGVEWNGLWAQNCDWSGQDFYHVLTRGEDCFSTCERTVGCTHFTWNDFNGGTCWMKMGKVCKSDAFYSSNTVCGLITACENDDTGPADLVKGDLVWSDEFDYSGEPSADNWEQIVAGHGFGNNELQFYTENSNVESVGGYLYITTKKEDYGGKRYTSSRLESKKKFKYGIFEMRAKLPQGLGIWSAFWMLSAKEPLNWPYDGEFDIMENVGFDPKMIVSTAHTAKFNHQIGTQVGKSYYLQDPNNEFHTYTIDWTPTYIRTYVDNHHFFTFENRDSSMEAWPFDSEFKLILNVAVGGNWGASHGVDDSIFPTTYVVDYVRQYSNGFEL